MKKILAIILVVIMILTTAPMALAASKEQLTMGTGGESGTYFAVGGVLANVLNEKNPDIMNVNVVSTGGSADNLQNMAFGIYQLATVQSDVMTYAYNGTRSFAQIGAVPNVRILAGLYAETVQIVTTDPNIKTVADLKGKNVSVGDSGSGVYFNALDVLGAYDLTLDDIKPTYQSFGDSTEALQDGKIDAAFIVSGAPTTAITSLAATNDVYLVELDDEHIEKLVAASPYYSKNVIAADAYGLEKDATTVAIAAVIIARDDCSEDAIYDVVAGIFNDVDGLSHAKKDELSLDFAASVSDVPYHAGAAKYFAEQGITVPTK